MFYARSGKFKDTLDTLSQLLSCGFDTRTRKKLEGSFSVCDFDFGKIGRGFDKILDVFAHPIDTIG